MAQRQRQQLLLPPSPFLLSDKKSTHTHEEKNRSSREKSICKTFLCTFARKDRRCAKKIVMDLCCFGVCLSVREKYTVEMYASHTISLTIRMAGVMVHNKCQCRELSRKKLRAPHEKKQPHTRILTITRVSSAVY